MNTTKKTNKFTRFLRNNAALLILILCVLAIATVVLVVTLTNSTPDIPDNPVVVDPGHKEPDNPEPVIKEKIKVYFAAPVKHTSVGMDYTDGKDTLFVFSATLKEWAAHKGVDLVAADGTEVNAMYDGVVTDVQTTFGMGSIVTIDHGDNVVATYASLSDVQVIKGQTVKKGEKIGAVSTSASNEFMDGAHLHLEVAKNGANVDPTPYVNGTIFREIEQD